MKRRDVVRHLQKQGCALAREGANHTIYRNPANGLCAPAPRHREIKDTLVLTICDQPRIPRP